MKKVRRVWDDLAGSPEEADDWASRAELLITLQEFLEGMDPCEISSRYGVATDVAVYLLAGRISELSMLDLRETMEAVVRIEGPL